MLIRSPEETKALEWAKNQNFTSVAATYARLLAGYIDRLEEQLETEEHEAENQRKRDECIGRYGA